MLKIHQYAIMCAPTMSQYAAIVALRDCDHEVQKMVDEYNVRRRILVDGFNRIGLTCFDPEGAFYIFPCIRSTGMNSETFCARLLEEEKVAVVPGNAFGESGEGFVRVSYAYSLKHLMEALSCIERFVKRHAQGE
jgi:aminotransferase